MSLSMNVTFRAAASIKPRRKVNSSVGMTFFCFTYLVFLNLGTHYLVCYLTKATFTQ